MSVDESDGMASCAEPPAGSVSSGFLRERTDSGIALPVNSTLATLEIRVSSRSCGQARGITLASGLQNFGDEAQDGHMCFYSSINTTARA